MWKFLLVAATVICYFFFLNSSTSDPKVSTKTIWRRKYKKILKRNPVSIGKRVEHLLRADAEQLSAQQKVRQQTADLQSHLSATSFECRIARLLHEGDILSDQINQFYSEVRSDVVILLAEQYNHEAEILSQRVPTDIHTDEILATQKKIDDLTDRILQYEAHLTKKELRCFRLVSKGKVSPFELPSSMRYLSFDCDFVLNSNLGSKLREEKHKLELLLKVSIGLNASNEEIVDCYSRSHARRRFLHRGLLFLRRSLRRLSLNSLQRTVFDGVMYRNKLYETIFPHPTGWSSKANIHADLINFLRKNKDPAYWVRSTFDTNCEQYDLQKIIHAIAACVLDFEISETSSRYNNPQVSKEIRTMKTHLNVCCKELRLFGISSYEFRNAKHKEDET